MNKNDYTKILEKRIKNVVNIYTDVSEQGYKIYILDNVSEEQYKEWGLDKWQKPRCKIIFYTENQELSDQFQSLVDSNNYEKIRTFLHENYDCVNHLNVLKKVRSMSDEYKYKFKNLAFKNELTRTLKEHDWGFAHLIENNEVLTFFLPSDYQHSFKFLFKSKDLNVVSDYQTVQKDLYKLYKSGVIKPLDIFRDNLAEIIIKNLKSHGLILDSTEDIKSKKLKI